MSSYLTRKLPYGLPSSAANLRRQLPWYTYVSGYAALDSDLTANSITETAILRLDGTAGASTWVPTIGAINFAESGAGTSPNYNVSGDYGESVEYINSGKIHQAASNGYSIALEDFAVEITWRYTTAANATPIYKYGSNIGWLIDTPTSGEIRLYLRNGGTALDIRSSGAGLVDNTWHHVIAFVDRDEASTNGARLYLDGSLTASGNPSALAATTIETAAHPVRVGAASTAPNDMAIGHAIVWRRSSWFAGGVTNASEWAAIAAARYAAIS